MISQDQQAKTQGNIKHAACGLSSHQSIWSRAPRTAVTSHTHHSYKHKQTRTSNMFLHGCNCSDLSWTRPHKFSMHTHITVTRRIKIMKQNDRETELHYQLPLAEACGLFALYCLLALYFHALLYVCACCVVICSSHRVSCSRVWKQWFPLRHFTAVWLQMTNTGAEINFIKHRSRNQLHQTHCCFQMH